MAKKVSENKIQADCWQWLWNTYPRTRRLYFSIPLGGLRLPSEAATLQATGAVPGTPDTLLSISSSFKNGIKYPVLYIEFKTATGVVSEAQEKSQTALKDAGNGVILCRSLEEFKKIIHEYLGGTEYLLPL